MVWQDLYESLDPGAGGACTTSIAPRRDSFLMKPAIIMRGETVDLEKHGVRMQIYTGEGARPGSSTSSAASSTSSGPVTSSSCRRKTASPSWGVSVRCSSRSPLGGVRRAAYPGHRGVKRRFPPLTACRRRPGSTRRGRRGSTGSCRSGHARSRAGSDGRRGRIPHGRVCAPSRPGCK